MNYDLPQGGYLWFQDTEQLLALFSFFFFHYWVLKSQFAIILQFMIFFSTFGHKILAAIV